MPNSAQTLMANAYTRSQPVPIRDVHAARSSDLLDLYEILTERIQAREQTTRGAPKWMRESRARVRVVILDRCYLGNVE